MSCINNASAFAITNGIGEISFDEIDQVVGGVKSRYVRVVEVVACLLPPGASAIIAGFELGWHSFHRSR